MGGVASSLVQVEDTACCAVFLDEQSMQKGSEHMSAQCGQASQLLDSGGTSSSMDDRDAGAASGTSLGTEKSVLWDSDDDDPSSSDDASGATMSSWRFSDLIMSSRRPLRCAEAFVEECSLCWLLWS